MPNIYKQAIAFILSFSFLQAQSQTNKGTEFWVGYGHHQFMEASCNGSIAGDNTMNMRVYLSNSESTTATVTITIDSSGAIPSNAATWFTRTYTINPNTVIETENLPKGAINATASSSDQNFDARLVTDAPPAGTGGEGIFRKKGIHIVSNVPIVAYAHIYGSVSSGATMLLPVSAWGDNYATINSEQGGSVSGSYSWMYVIAKEDNTVIEITPSQLSRLGKPAGTPFQVTLMKGQIYQLIGDAVCSTGTGVQLTGTTVRSFNSKPIAVFAGSSRTGGETTLCGAGGRDNDMQQCFPKSSWGTKYLTAPASTSTGTTSSTTLFQTQVYKVMVNDPTTVVIRNGVTLSGLINSSYYQFKSSTADYIRADKPIMVATFMSNGGSCASGGNGDPEMIYLSPLEQGIKKTVIYRTNLENIQTNHVTLVIPTAGLTSLTINNVTSPSNIYSHPNLAGYSIVCQNWTASKSQVIINSDSAFTGYTYGLGSAESYGYNIGGNFATINSIVPVTLLDFSASKIQNDIVLNWKTANEINLDKFEVQRSLDATSFSFAASIIASKAGLYSLNDKNAVKDFASAKTLYYRLKMMDKDGSSKFSSIVPIKLDKHFKGSLSVYPNPFVNEIKLRINTENAGLANISINDISGRLLESKSIFVPQGSNLVSFDNLEKLNSGVYVLSVEMNGNKEYYKLMK